jgi:hypothetical protein
MLSFRSNKFMMQIKIVGIMCTREDDHTHRIKNVEHAGFEVSLVHPK